MHIPYVTWQNINAFVQSHQLIMEQRGFTRLIKSDLLCYSYAKLNHDLCISFSYVYASIINKESLFSHWLYWERVYFALFDFFVICAMYFIYNNNNIHSKISQLEFEKGKMYIDVIPASEIESLFLEDLHLKNIIVKSKN